MLWQKHGMSKGYLHRLWTNVKTRCSNPKDPCFHNYGGRGIAMHDEWTEDFCAFADAVGDRPSSAHTLERIDNENGYVPGNVRWATRKEQARNMRKNVNLTLGDKTQCVAAWAEELGLAPSTIWYRVFTAGMPLEQALTTPSRRKRRAN